MAKPKVKPEIAPAAADAAAAPESATPEFTPATPALPNVDVAPVEPPVPAEPAPPVEPVAGGVPRGAPDGPTDDAAPYGRDADGKPIAPYGYKADGVTPAKKRGRKGADASGDPSASVPRGTLAEAADKPEKPKREKRSAVENALAALDSAKESGDGYWTVEADERRCERARRNQADFVDLAEIAIEMGEPVMLGLVRSSLLTKNPDKRAQIDAILSRIKPMREIKFKFAGREISVLTGNAEALAFVLAYFSPWRPSHPLLRSAIQLLLSQRAYLAHVRDAANAALAASAAS